ncbi:MAG: hypothetical protein ACI9YM_001269 [Brevundimonas sp.]|jgi:hypothetical protein|uniref:hypothetical protein n=1 Tax=Brevundimonas sp. TaxID=1871086 RepID=UPI0039E5DE6B
MAFATFGPVPFPPLQLIDRDLPIDGNWLTELLAERQQASFLVRSAAGNVKRGGYFFHVRKTPDGVQFVEFAGVAVVTLTISDAVNLINHASGRKFNSEMLLLCQQAINLRQDD